MGNTKTLIKSLATGIPDLADMVDDEVIWVEDSEVLYKRVDATTLISNSGFTNAKVALAPSVVLNTAKTGVTKTSVEAVLAGEITTHTHSAEFQSYGIGTSSTTSSARVVATGDCDDMKESGFYFVADAVTNKPISSGGHLIVNNNQSTTNDNKVTQIFTPKNTNDLYIRINDTGWESWVKMVYYKSYVVSGLPTGVQGDVAYVTDALTPSYLGTVVGGGAVVCPVFYDGTNWICS